MTWVRSTASRYCTCKCHFELDTLSWAWLGATVTGLDVSAPAVDAATPIWAIVAVMILSLGTGVGFGVLPAWRAANLDPVAALQGH